MSLSSRPALALVEPPFLFSSAKPCASEDCATTVPLHAHCDECLTTAAIELARTFEERLLENHLGLDELDMRSALAGYAMMRESSWYETHSPLGSISHTEAIILRAKTDQACFLVARGGVAALRHMRDLPLPLALRSEVPASAPEPAKGGVLLTIPVHVLPGITQQVPAQPEEPFWRRAVLATLQAAGFALVIVIAVIGYCAW